MRSWKNLLTKRTECVIRAAAAFAFAFYLPNLMMGILSGTGKLTGIVSPEAGRAYEASMRQLTGTAAFNDVFMAVYACLCMLGCILCLKLRKSRMSDDRHAQENARSRWLPGIMPLIILTPGMQFLTDYIYNGIYMLKPEWITAYENSAGAMYSGSGIMILSVLYTILLAPLSEELIFRRIIQSCLKQATGYFRVANIMQAALFGVFHGNIVQGLYTFVMGLFFGIAYEKGGSLAYPIILHILYNAASMYVMEPLEKLIPQTACGDILVAAVTAVSVAAGLVLLKRENFKDKERSAV